MEHSSEGFKIYKGLSAIIPTVGRPDYLRKCLESLITQKVKIDEVIIIDASFDNVTHVLVADSFWEQKGLKCKYFKYGERNAAAQRNFGVSQSIGEWLLFMDDDVELDSTWSQELLRPMLEDINVAATRGAIINQPFPKPSPLWRAYHRLVVGRSVEQAQGKVVGAVLANGFMPLPNNPVEIEWIGGGVSAVRRSAFAEVGGFAPYFTGPSPGEDIDLGYRLSRKWKVLYVPAAVLYHHEAASGRVPLSKHQYHSMRSRYAILRRAMGYGYWGALYHIVMWAIFQSISELFASRKQLSLTFLAAWWGRLLGFASCVFWNPPTTSPIIEQSALRLSAEDAQ